MMKKIPLTILVLVVTLALSSCGTTGGGTVKIPLNDKGGALEFDWEVLDDK